VIDSERLPAVNGMLASTQALARLGAPAVAGALVAVIGGPQGLWFLGGLYAASALSTLLLPETPTCNEKVGSHRVDLVRGWRSFVSRRWLWVTVAWYAITSALVLGPVYVLGPVLAVRHYGGSEAWGLILGSGGVGAVGGGAIAAFWRPRRRLRHAIAGYSLAALLPGALGGAAPLSIVLLSALVGGVVSGLFSATWFTIFQQNVPTDVLARTSAWDWLGSLAVLPLAMIGVAPLASSLGNEVVLSGGALMAAAVSMGVAATRTVASIAVSRSDQSDP
jgi:MFS transporter